MVEVAERLLTPVGLRSLAPDDPDYKPRYYGDLRARDAAYHQGTVWAWLIGPFIDAYLKVYPDDRPGARKFLDGFWTHLDTRAASARSAKSSTPKPPSPPEAASPRPGASPRSFAPGPGPPSKPRLTHSSRIARRTNPGRFQTDEPNDLEGRVQGVVGAGSSPWFSSGMPR